MDQSEHGQLKAAIERLCLNDRSVSVSIETRSDIIIYIIMPYLIMRFIVVMIWNFYYIIHMHMNLKQSGTNGYSS